MIKIKTKEGSVTGYVGGSLNELMADTIMMVRHIYQCIKNQDEDAAEDYEYCLKKAFEDDVPFCDDDDLGDIVKDSVGKMKEKVEETEQSEAKCTVKEMLDDAIKEIDSLSKELKGLMNDGK